MMKVNHDGDGRHMNPFATPLPTTTVREGSAIVMPPAFVAMLRKNGQPIDLRTDALPTFTTSKHHGLAVMPPDSFLMKSYGGHAEDRHMIKSPKEPFGTMRASGNDFLVVPFRRGSAPHTSMQPISTVTTRTQHGVMRSALAIEDVRFRMLTPREAATAQRFPRDYTILGTLGEQQLQAGNAVPVNVAQWIGTEVAAILDGAA